MDFPISLYKSAVRCVPWGVLLGSLFDATPITPTPLALVKTFFTIYLFETKWLDRFHWNLVWETIPQAILRKENLLGLVKFRRLSLVNYLIHKTTLKKKKIKITVMIPYSLYNNKLIITIINLSLKEAWTISRRPV